MTEPEEAIARLTAVVEAFRSGDLTIRCGPLLGPFAPLGTALDEALDGLARDLTQLGGAAAELAGLAEQIDSTVRLVNRSAENQTQAVSEIARKLHGIGARCEDVGQIVELLEDVAAETNILALNAAIEASRAGTQGKGFGLVAEEVRKLAERSAVASKDIGAFIQLLDASSGENVRAIEGVRDLAQEIALGAARTAEAADRMASSADGVGHTLGRFRIPSGRDADLVRLLRERRSDLERALGGLATLIDDPDLRPTPVAQALRRLRSALSSLDDTNGATLGTEPQPV